MGSRFKYVFYRFWIKVNANLSCRLEDQEHEESIETVDQQAENEGLDSD